MKREDLLLKLPITHLVNKIMRYEKLLSSIEFDVGCAQQDEEYLEDTILSIDKEVIQ